ALTFTAHDSTAHDFSVPRRTTAWPGHMHTEIRPREHLPYASGQRRDGVKAIRVHQTGGPEALRLEELPVPDAGKGEALVKIEAAGVNYTDIYYRMGWTKAALPFTVGVEAAGVVERVGPEVSGLKQGDRVAYTGPLGAYAEYAVVPAWRRVPRTRRDDARPAATPLAH